MSTDEKIIEEAIKFARKNKNEIAKEITDLSKYPPPNDPPVSVFMAGSPGAGKTEFSRNLGQILITQNAQAIRIDGDELRSYFPDYTGSNSRLFQAGISILIDRIHDLVLKNKQSFILDGTLWNQKIAVENINRSLKRGRTVYIFYIYQKPEIAWEFTQKRELTEGRNIPKTAFIEQFFGARNTVNYIKDTYSDEVNIYLIEQDRATQTILNIYEMTRGQSIDDYLPLEYTKKELERIL